MTKLAHSYSSLKMFENCPKNYYHQRIEKSVKDLGNAVTIYGERIHKSLELRLGEGAMLGREAERYEALCASIEKIAANGVLTVEEEMTLNQSLKPTGWWDADAWLRSKIDVLVRNGPDAIMFDWKTGKRRPDFDQLELFAVQVFKHYPEVQRLKATFVWLKEMKMDHETFTRLDMPAIWQRILGKITRIEGALEHDNWPAKPSGLCNYCPCKSFCEYANRR
jgi:hypothetical protein